MTGILSIDSRDACVLFDSRATHSFISPFFAITLRTDPSPIGELLIMATPMGHSLLANSMYKSYEILLEGKSLMVDEILIPGDRCRTGCHDIALQNMQIVYDSMNRLNK